MLCCAIYNGTACSMGFQLFFVNYHMCNIYTSAAYLSKITVNTTSIILKIIRTLFMLFYDILHLKFVYHNILLLFMHILKYKTFWSYTLIITFQRFSKRYFNYLFKYSCFCSEFKFNFVIFIDFQIRQLIYWNKLLQYKKICFLFSKYLSVCCILKSKYVTI